MISVEAPDSLDGAVLADELAAAGIDVDPTSGIRLVGTTLYVDSNDQQGVEQVVAAHDGPAFRDGVIEQAAVPSLTPTAWSWWTRPRAVAWSGVVYVGAVDRTGAVVVDEYDSATSIRARHQISALAGERDDHNNPAVVLESGKPPIIFYARHAKEGTLRYRVGTSNFTPGDRLGQFGDEQTIDFSGLVAGTNRVTYVQAFVHSTLGLYVFTRCADTSAWAWTKSTDWGGTWSQPQLLFDSTSQLYMPVAQIGSSLRFALSNHPINGSPPDQDVYYAEAYLPTGGIYSGVVGDTIVGNLDGTNLPLAIGDLEQVAAPAQGKVSWVYDVGRHSAPEVVWASFDPSDVAGTATYHYSVRADGTWTTVDICSAGEDFSMDKVENYLGGAQLYTIGSGGTVVVSRFIDGMWRLEQYATGDGGQTWSVTVLDREPRPGLAVVRPWPVDKRDAAATPFGVAANWTDEFLDYREWYGNTGPLRMPTARPLTPASPTWRNAN